MDGAERATSGHVNSRGLGVRADATDRAPHTDVRALERPWVRSRP